MACSTEAFNKQLVQKHSKNGTVLPIHIYMKSSRILSGGTLYLTLRVILTIASLAFALPVFAKDNPPPPEPRVVQSSLATAEDTVKEVYFSHQASASNPKMHPSTDIIAKHREFVQQVIDGTLPGLRSTPPAQRHITMEFYGLGDAPLVEKLIEAHKKGIKVTILTDLNQSLDGVAKGEKFSGDFAKLSLKRSDDAKALESFRAAGATVGTESSFTILSQPVYNTQEVERIPIFHKKDMFVTILPKDTKGAEKIAFWSTGTSNMNSGAPRVNRFYVMNPDCELAQDAYQHTLRTRSAFLAGKEIKQV